MARFKKGSAAAKAYMAKLRAMVGKHRTRTALKERSEGKKSKKERKVGNLGKRRRRRGGMTIPLAPVLGLSIGFVTPRPGWSASPLQLIMTGDYAGAMNSLGSSYLGWNPYTNQWQPELMSHGLVPLAIGLLVHKVVGGRPLNLNALLARAKVPFIRI